MYCFSTIVSCAAFIFRRYIANCPSTSRRTFSISSSGAWLVNSVCIFSSRTVKRRSKSSKSSVPGVSRISALDSSDSTIPVKRLAISGCLCKLFSAACFNRSTFFAKYFLNSSRENASLSVVRAALGELPAAASCCSSAASSTASVQYARFFSGLPAPRRDLW